MALIRESQMTDLSDLLSLYTDLHDNPIPAITPAITDLWQRIQAAPDHHIIVSEADGRLVSSCVLVVIPNLTHAQRPYALIENVITRPDYRLRGHATQVLRFAKATAAAQNCYKIMLMTGSKDPAVLHFYETCGYNQTDKTAFVQWLK